MVKNEPKKRNCVQLDAEYYQKLKRVKKKTGKPIVEILRRAIDEIK